MCLPIPLLPPPLIPVSLSHLPRWGLHILEKISLMPSQIKQATWRTLSFLKAESKIAKLINWLIPLFYIKSLSAASSELEADILQNT
jgi:hypothetical protein